MESYVKSQNQLAKAVVQEAVDQCNQIEISLEGCLKVLQKIRMPHLTIDDENMEEIMENNGELSPKRSYTVCIGRKSPDLIDIDDAEDFRVDNLIEYAGRKLQSILQTQESILQRLDAVNEKIWRRYPNCQ